MDHPSRMRGRESLCDLAAHVERIAQRERSIAKAIRQGLARKPFQDENENAASALFEAIDRRDVGMVHRRQESRLPCQLGDSIRRVRDVGWEELERDGPLERRIAREIDNPHAAFA